MAIHIEKDPQKKFRITCEYCSCTFTYEQEDLGFRPWYPHGFVYCPKCQKPLRHNAEKYEIKDNVVDV